MKILIQLIFIVIISFSCDYKVTEEFIVNNDSGYDLILQASFVESRRHNISDTIPAGVQKVFFSNSSSSGISGLITGQCNDLKIFKSIRIFVNDSLMPSKDISKCENWKFKLIKKNAKNNGAKECLSFTVENKDYCLSLSVKLKKCIPLRHEYRRKVSQRFSGVPCTIQG